MYNRIQFQLPAHVLGRQAPFRFYWNITQQPGSSARRRGPLTEHTGNWAQLTSTCWVRTTLDATEDRGWKSTSLRVFQVIAFQPGVAWTWTHKMMRNLFSGHKPCHHSHLLHAPNAPKMAPEKTLILGTDQNFSINSEADIKLPFERHSAILISRQLLFLSSVSKWGVFTLQGLVRISPVFCIYLFICLWILRTEHVLNLTGTKSVLEEFHILLCFNKRQLLRHDFFLLRYNWHRTPY